METTLVNTPPPQLEVELREKTARLNALEQRANNLQQMIATGRRDADFDLFCRRLQMAEIFSNLPPEALRQIYLTDFYTDFWKLAGEAHRRTKFAEEEKNISRQVLERARQESNPVRRQFFALLLIIFGELQEAQRLIDQNLWAQQLRQDFDAFAKWNRLVSTSLSPQLRAKIARNEQILAFLQEKYSALIKKYANAVINEETCPRVRPEDYQIYFCWLQGEANFPPIVRCCYNSLKQNAGRYKIVFIDEQNFSNYVDIPPHIMDKFRAGKISRTHFSDILRVNLLERYGGLWLDASILITEPLENYEYLWKKSFFSQKFFHERDIKNPFSNNISFGRWMVGIQGTNILHNPLFVFLKEFFSEYLLNNDDFLDYFLLDFGLSLAYDNIFVVKNECDTVPVNNISVHTLKGAINIPYANFPYDKILTNTFLFSVPWKLNFDMTTPGTVFREIQRRYAPETIKP